MSFRNFTTRWDTRSVPQQRLPHDTSRHIVILVAVKQWWRHQMETLSALLALCAGNSPVTGEFPSQRPVTRSFDVFFDLCMNNGWINTRDAGYLRRHCADYDVTVIGFNHGLPWCVKYMALGPPVATKPDGFLAVLGNRQHPKHHLSKIGCNSTTKNHKRMKLTHRAQISRK